MTGGGQGKVTGGEDEGVEEVKGGEVEVEGFGEVGEVEEVDCWSLTPSSWQRSAGSGSRCWGTSNTVAKDLLPPLVVVLLPTSSLVREGVELVRSLKGDVTVRVGIVGMESILGSRAAVVAALESRAAVAREGREVEWAGWVVLWVGATWRSKVAAAMVAAAMVGAAEVAASRRRARKSARLASLRRRSDGGRRLARRAASPPPGPPGPPGGWWRCWGCGPAPAAGAPGRGAAGGPRAKLKVG